MSETMEVDRYYVVCVGSRYVHYCDGLTDDIDDAWKDCNMAFAYQKRDSARNEYDKPCTVSLVSVLLRDMP